MARGATLRSVPALAPFTVLYDRDCGFCTWSADWIRRADRKGRLRVVALQDAPDDADLAAAVAGHDLRCALHAVDEAGVVHRGGDAVLSIQERLPGGALITAWRRLPGAAALAERAYAVAARNRDRLGGLVGAGGGTACEVPR
jgi:predicted DCC family thiol-disulfide oxidoreductase YuxK